MDKLISLTVLDILVVFIGASSLLFIKYLGFSENVLLIAATIFIIVLGIIYIRRAFLKKNI